MNALLERTPNIIAAEINSIKDQTRKMILFNSIEIGRRLAEAKSMVPHGEWGKWLEESVDYSQSTANNLMRIFEEYGSRQISIFDNNAKSQALGNLSYTQAVALLSIPEEEREAFIQEHDIDNMSTRELQQAIKERDQALKEKEELQNKLDNTQKAVSDITEERDKFKEEASYFELNIRETDQLLKEKQEDIKKLQEALEKERQQSKEKVRSLEEKIITAKEDGSSEEKVQELEELLEAAQDQVKKLTEQLNSPQVIEASIVEKIPPEVEEELQQLRERTKELESKTLLKSDKAVLKFGVHFDALVKCFSDLLSTLAEIEDEEAKERYQKAVSGLITKMSERI